MQSQIDTLDDRLERIEAKVDDLNLSLKIALRLVRTRIAAELQGLKDVGF